MNNSDNSENKSAEEALRKEIDEAKSIGEKLSALGGRISDEGQSKQDYAIALEGILDTSPQFIEFEQVIDYYKQSNKSGREYLNGVFQYSVYLDTAGTTDTTASVVVSLHIPGTIRLEEYPSEKRYLLAKKAIDNWNDVYSKDEVKQKAMDLLNKWGFDISYSDTLSPLDLFLTAYAAFEHPVTEQDPVNTSLIPMRQSILSVIDGLKNLRPMRSNVKKGEEIIAIGHQLKSTHVDTQLFIDWTCIWVRIHKNLSGSKDVKMSRELWRKHLQEATLFLTSLLSGLDISKARQR